ncbi:MAG: hypothetical protein V1858_05475 [Candidatus Gottesmanbacteria bacterium]
MQRIEQFNNSRFALNKAEIPKPQWQFTDGQHKNLDRSSRSEIKQTAKFLLEATSLYGWTAGSILLTTWLCSQLTPEQITAVTGASGLVLTTATLELSRHAANISAAPIRPESNAFKNGIVINKTAQIEPLAYQSINVDTLPETKLSLALCVDPSDKTHQIDDKIVFPVRYNELAKYANQMTLGQLNLSVPSECFANKWFKSSQNANSFLNSPGYGFGKIPEILKQVLKQIEVDPDLNNALLKYVNKGRIDYVDIFIGGALDPNFETLKEGIPGLIPHTYPDDNNKYEIKLLNGHTVIFAGFSSFPEQEKQGIPILPNVLKHEFGHLALQAVDVYDQAGFDNKIAGIIPNSIQGCGMWAIGFDPLTAQSEPGAANNVSLDVLNRMPWAKENKISESGIYYLPPWFTSGIYLAIPYYPNSPHFIFIINIENEAFGPGIQIIRFDANQPYLSPLSADYDSSKRECQRTKWNPISVIPNHREPYTPDSSVANISDFFQVGESVGPNHGLAPTTAFKDCNYGPTIKINSKLEDGTMEVYIELP